MLDVEVGELFYCSIGYGDGPTRREERIPFGRRVRCGSSDAAYAGWTRDASCLSNMQCLIEGYPSTTPPARFKAQAPHFKERPPISRRGPK